MKFNLKNMTWFWVALSALLLGISRLSLYTAPLALLSFLPLFHYLDLKRYAVRQIILMAFVFALTYNLVSLHWIALVTFPGFLGMIPLFTLYFALVFGMSHYLWHRLPSLRLMGFLFCWMSFEFLSNFGELRFPWFNLGYSFAGYPILIQVADIGGVYLISVMVMLVNVFFYGILRHQRSASRYLAVILILWLGYGLFRLQTTHLSQQPDRIYLMQPSIPQEDKWDDHYFMDIMNKYENLTHVAKNEGADLVIWPEAAIPAYLLQTDVLTQMIRNLCEQERIDLFTGFPDAIPAPKEYPVDHYYYNSASLIHADGRVDTPYYKNILVPIGERMPLLRYLPFMWKLQFGQANWEYGSKPGYFTSQGHTFSPLICFEIAFPDHIARICRQKTDYLVNITNDAWFYFSRGTYQHAEMTKVRAVETRKQIYRCANTGISFVIDPLGRTLIRTKLFEERVITAPLYLTNGESIYVRGGVYSPWLYLLGVVFLILLARYQSAGKNAGN